MQWLVEILKLLLDELAWVLEAAISKYCIYMKEDCSITAVKPYVIPR